MSNIATICVYSDPHLSSKNYGAHNNYPKESIELFEKIVNVAKDRKATHVMGLGDFTYGRFNTLEYRTKVEDLLNELNNLTHNNHYALEGNHDRATYGMTEYQYYIANGRIKPATNLTIGNLHISMVNYGKIKETEMNIDNEDVNAVNIVLAHDYLKFKDTLLPNFGKEIVLDNLENLFGTDILICGHVHKIMSFSGSICNGTTAHETKVLYPGCMMRPSYREGHMDTKGQIIVINVTDNGSIEFDIEEFDLPPIEESFNIEKIDERQEEKIEKESRVDISDIVKELNAHDRTAGNPEDIIEGLTSVDDKYKSKAIELLKLAQG